MPVILPKLSITCRIGPLVCSVFEFRFKKGKACHLETWQIFLSMFIVRLRKLPIKRKKTENVTETQIKTQNESKFNTKLRAGILLTRVIASLTTYYSIFS